MITLKTAKAIAAEWHGGQWSALYAFASSGVINAAQEPHCLSEIENELNSTELVAGQRRRLERLKEFINDKIQENGKSTQ